MMVLLLSDYDQRRAGRSSMLAGDGVGLTERISIAWNHVAAKTIEVAGTSRATTPWAWSAACSNRTRGDENKEPRDRICAPRGSAHVEERYLPCVDGSCRLCGASGRDVKVR